MSALSQFNRLGNYVLGSYKTIIHGRTNWLNASQMCNYSVRKSAEEKLGIDKPKRPLTPFFKFMAQLRPVLLAKNPGLTSKEAIQWISKHWQQLDAETKQQMGKEYEKDIEDYRKIKAIYESSLTEEQKENIKRVKEEMVIAREKRKTKVELRELGKPKRPMSSFLLFGQSLKHLMEGKSLAEFQKIVQEKWVNLSVNEKAKFEKQAQDRMDQYRKELAVWEEKMVTEGRADLVRIRRSSSEKKVKNVQKQK